MQRLLVYQSLWAMERRRPDGAEWSLETKLDMIHSAGFDGAGVGGGSLVYANTLYQPPDSYFEDKHENILW